MTLGAQSVDSNSLLGNVDLSYRYHFFDGAVIPIGLGLSLILNGLLLAGKINAEENVLTLPDVLSKRYGKVVEVMVGLVSITSFLMLLAGNLVGMGRISAYVWDINETVAIWVSAIIVWTYTVTGGLFSVAYTDVVQGAAGWYVQKRRSSPASFERGSVFSHLFAFPTGLAALFAATGSLPTPQKALPLLRLATPDTSTRTRKSVTCTMVFPAPLLRGAATTAPSGVKTQTTLTPVLVSTMEPTPLAMNVSLATK